jgi:hypothetical protein
VITTEQRRLALITLLNEDLKKLDAANRAVQKEIDSLDRVAWWCLRLAVPFLVAAVVLVGVAVIPTV